jgi:tripartite-type tricarboxylate transporter receptor subunit TctC
MMTMSGEPRAGATRGVRSRVVGKTGVLVSAACAALLVTAVPATSGATASEFYSGKRIALIVGFNPAGTYDVYARIVANWLPNYIPGKPTIVVQNMPGAGGAKAANFLFAQGSRDGLTIGTVSQAMALGQAVKDPTVSYDATKFAWIGRVTPVTEMSLTWHTSPTKTIQDAMTRETVVASTGAGSTPYLMPLVMNRVVGTKLKLVRGYPGTTGGLLAMERGEVEGGYATAETLLFAKAQWLKERTINVLVQYSQHRHPAFPDVPTVVELGKSGADRQVLSLFGSTAEIGRSFLAPPGVPAERVNILRTAFDAMTNDPAFKQELAQKNMEFGPLGGAALQDMISATLQISPEIANRAAQAQASE